MTQHWLVRARLRQDASAAALAPLLLPSDPNARVHASHRLIWSLLTDGPDRRRDFLWRETSQGTWIALTPRRPNQWPDLFDVDVKEFAPVLRAGQRLGFNLRVNPVRAQKPDAARKRGRGKRVDVMTTALKDIAPNQRGDARDAALRTWLERQGERNGFRPEAGVRVDDEAWVKLPRTGGPQLQFCAVTIEGALTVHDPAAFSARLLEGFGAAKAFGCGLMLIRPAPPAAGADADGDGDGEDDLP